MNKQNVNDYIMWCFFNFIRTPGNSIKTENGGLKLKPGINYQWTATPNPNAKQVCDELWREIITNSLNRYNNN